jgi:hypothetical protein
LELQGLGTLARVGWTTLALTLALIGLALLSSTARAASTAGKAAADPNTPVLVSSQDTPPKGYRLTAAKVKRLALDDPRVRAELRRHPRALGYQYTKGPGQWQVSWFSAGKHQRELMQVYVDDASGQVTQVWTGFQVAWTMARGYAGAFGRGVNAWYIWLPLCLLFVAPFLPWPLRRRRLTLLHLDLLVLLSFSVSLAFFNHAQIGLSVPLTYPPLIYLLVRMLLLAAGKGIPRAPLKLLIPVPWLLVAAVFLVGFRVGLNLTNSNVIDVGYSGVIGANRLVHDQPLYGGWPKDNPQGDTYAPVAYYAYVPFRAIFGWSGTWDDLPAAHARGGAGVLLGRVPVQPVDAQLQHQRHVGCVADRPLAARYQQCASPWHRRRAGRPDQVRAVRARAPVAWRSRRASAQALRACLRARLRAGRARGDAAGPPVREPARLLARLGFLPIRARDPVLDLGPVGRPRL